MRIKIKNLFKPKTQKLVTSAKSLSIQILMMQALNQKIQLKVT